MSSYLSLLDTYTKYSPSVPLLTLDRIVGADTLELAGAGGGVGGAGDCWVTSLSGAGVDGSDLTSLLSSTS